MEEHFDYRIFHDIKDYPNKPGLLIVTKLYNAESEIHNFWNIKFQISSEIKDCEAHLEEEIQERTKLQEKQMVRVYNFYKDMIEGNL